MSEALPPSWGDHTDDGRCPIANCVVCIQAELDADAAERLGPLHLQRKGTRMSYDTKCYDLAEAFLSDEEFVSKDHIAALAQEIQDCIEQYIQWEQDRYR